MCEPSAGQRDELLGVVAEDVGRHLVEQRLEGLADHRDVVRVLVVGVGVVLGVARDLLDVLVVVLPEQQVVAVLHRANVDGISSGMKPCLVSSSSWMMSGRSRLSAYENVVNQKPGRSSSVIAAPPTRWRRSMISVFSPDLAR